jgi:biotin carboxyl carrier protein
MEEIKVSIDGKEHIVKVEEEGRKLKVHLNGNIYDVETSMSKEQEDYNLGGSSDEAGSGVIKAEIPGTIFSIDVKEGQEVKKKQKIFSLVAMKMENQILSPVDGVVKQIKVKKDDNVNKGDVLMIIE